MVEFVLNELDILRNWHAIGFQSWFYLPAFFIYFKGRLMLYFIFYYGIFDNVVLMIPGFKMVMYFVQIFILLLFLDLLYFRTWFNYKGWSVISAIMTLTFGL